MNLRQIGTKVSKEHQKLVNSEKTIRKDLQTALEININIGELLIVAQTQAEDEGINFKDWIEGTQSFDYRQVNKYKRIAKHKEQARLTVFKNEEEAVTVDQLQKVLPKYNDPIEVTAADISKIPELATPKDKARNKNDWHTPTLYLDMAREVMGSIELDPFSSEQANTRVNATHIYTMADDALSIEWQKVKTVWMNPPYSDGIAPKAINKFLEQRDKYKQALVLMNAATDTNWFDKLRLEATAVCLTKGRISFEDAGGKKVSGNTKGQAFFYYGLNTKKFCEVFSKIGWVVPGGECHA